MPFTKINRQLKSLIDISGQELAIFNDHCMVVGYEKNKCIVKRNNLSGKLFFINKGLCYSQKEESGKMMITDFHRENEFIIDSQFFLKVYLSLVDIYALDDMEIVEIPKPAIDFLFFQVVEGGKCLRKISEQIFLKQYQQLLEFRTISLETRITNFYTTYAGILDKLSQQKIALYLGISPEYFSKAKLNDNV